MPPVKMTKWIRAVLYFLGAYIVVLFILILVKFFRVVQG